MKPNNQAKHDFLKELGRDALGATLQAQVTDFRLNPSCSHFQTLLDSMLAYQDIENDKRAARESLLSEHAKRIS